MFVSQGSSRITNFNYNWKMITKKFTVIVLAYAQKRLLRYFPLLNNYPGDTHLFLPLLQNDTSKKGRDLNSYLSYGLASSRTAIGIIAYLLPRIPSAPWVGGKEASRYSVKLFARTLGARDLALGLGHLYSLTKGKDPQEWLVAGALADLGDSVATIISFDELPKPHAYAVLLLTISAFLLGAYLAIMNENQSLEN